ncbi:alpha-amylase [Bifidobacterium dolichotidis]|uniref:Alpha-amylase n=1 Tax=Bifidobacterium dolichotidis TaxID=2306976 RepID=A0A430FRL6_9BIFI|nr:Ig-like domain-containing protein [Bifidobacterium dolichotidis]RSX55521.1 alpha-amylase [Bifidobacterium dolichotidis]
MSCFTVEQQARNGEDHYNSPSWIAKICIKLRANIRTNLHAIWGKITAAIVVIATLFGGAVVTTSSAQAIDGITVNDKDKSLNRTIRNSAFESARNSYGLAKEIKHGAILHAWMWSFNTIKNNMKDIAEAGYTAVQTTPISHIKGPEHGKQFKENWYYVYQPTDTRIGNNVVGTEDEFRAMTAEAHKYGVRIIVDGVINHFTSDWGRISSDWQQPKFFHKDDGICNGSIDYNDRWQVTQCQLSGLWDLHTQDQEVAKRMATFLKQIVDDGADGFRFDAAKHIELPSEFDDRGKEHSNYWPTVLKNGAQYQYGEILQGDDWGLAPNKYVQLFEQDSSNGGGFTASKYGRELREQIWGGKLNKDKLWKFQTDGARDDQVVTWVESHDTYANSDKESTGLNSQQLRMGWGAIGSRAGGTPLFFNRPVGSGGSNPQFAEQSQLGDAGDNEWKNPEVVAVNHFRNAMENNAEYVSNCGNTEQCFMVERYKSGGSDKTDGISITNIGSNDINLQGTKVQVADGTYTDQVNGGAITVSGKTIQSGTARGGKISVFSNAAAPKHGSVSITTSGSSFKTDTTTVTLNAKNVSNTRYSTSEGASGSYTDGQKLTVGAKTSIGQSVTITVSGECEDGSTVKDSVSLLKRDPSATVTYRAYAKKTQGWPQTYAYVYIDSQGAHPKPIENAPWPGILMDEEEGTCDGNADLVYEVPEDLIDQAEDYPVRVIFNNGGPGEKPGNKFPPDDPDESETHVDKEGLRIDGDYLWDGKLTVSDQSWTLAPCKPVIVDSVTITGAPGKKLDLDFAGRRSAKLGVTVLPKEAEKMKVTWKSSDPQVARVKDGTVTAVKKGTATITASVGGKSDSITVTVTGEAPAATSTYIFYPANKFGKDSTNLHYRLKGGEWTPVPGVPMQPACSDKYVRYKVDNPDQLEVEFVFNKDGKEWDNNGGKNYRGTGEFLTVENGKVTVNDPPCEVIVPVESVTVTPSSLALKKGNSAQLNAKVLPEDATDKKLTWSSSNAAVASVDQNGKVTAHKAGSASITATAGGVKSNTVAVTVTDPVVPVTEVEILDPASGKMSLVEGNSQAIKAKVKPEDATDKKLTWSSSNAAVASVDQNGKVTAHKAGTASITATAGGVKSKPVVVTVTKRIVPVSEVQILDPASGEMSLVTGESKAIKAKVLPEDATDKKLTWSSSNAAVASVDQNGKVTALKAGTASITATAGGVKSKPVAVTVTDVPYIPVTDVKILDPASGKLTLALGETKDIKAKALPDDATDKTISYSSTDASTVQVSKSGTVVAKKYGKAMIIASAQGHAAVVEVTVRSCSFSDVPDSAYQAPDIQWMADNGITKGYPDGTFGFGRDLVRQDLAVFLYRTAVLNGDESAKSFKPSQFDYERFKDVKPGTTGAKEILWLASRGVIKGFPDGTFRGSLPVNREDTAIYMHRFAVIEGDKSAESFVPTPADYARFKDVKSGSIGAKEILWLASVGITKGFPDGTFRGTNNLLREDTAVFLHRLYNEISKW